MVDVKKLDYRCSPHRLFSIFSQMNGAQKEVVKQIGFGTLLGMKDFTVRRNLITWLVSCFNVEDGSLEVHGKQFKLDSKIFTATMGVKDGVQDLVDSVSGDEPNDKGERLSMSILEFKLKQNQSTNMSFIRDFLLFLVSSFLMPKKGLKISRDFDSPILAIKDIATVSRVNWASMSYKFLWKSLRQFRAKPSQFVGGCIYFLQVFYCHHVAWKEGYVDKSLCPLNVWSEDDFKAVLDWVEQQGGFQSNTIPLLELQDGLVELKLPATISSLCTMVASLQKKMIDQENQIVKLEEVIQRKMSIEFERLRKSFSRSISSTAGGPAIPDSRKEKEAHGGDGRKFMDDPIEGNLQLNDGASWSKVWSRSDPMLIECGAGFMDEVENSFAKAPVSYNDNNGVEMEHDLNDCQPMAAPPSEENDVVEAATELAASQTKSTGPDKETKAVSVKKRLFKTTAQRRPVEKEREGMNRGKGKEIVLYNIISEHNTDGGTGDRVIHKIEDDDDFNIDLAIRKRDAQLCKEDKLFENMVATYMGSDGYQVGAFKFKQSVSVASFQLGLFLFYNSLSLRDVLVDTQVVKVERWYFKSLRPEGHVDVKVRPSAYVKIMSDLYCVLIQ
ncbi:uncharacterized protein LOC133795857 [Humulus lupulus]|uniref:uncharacterized protein LOC133795857 n=1 Tax=Humulus lupulus TaxID=3486 RepID=UPI002B408334|nr:uncharacterized protein LOC133795857 [Humulus lupulus]